MDTEKKYYKVVRKYNKQIFSAITRGKARVRYLSNQWVGAKKWVLENAGNYQLVVFNDLDKAIAWARARKDTTGLAIYECKIVHPRTRSKMPHRLSTYGLNRGYFDKAVDDNWPDGTIMAEAVCLTKQVWDIRSLEG